MSKSRAKKLRKRAKKDPQAPAGEEEEEEDGGGAGQEAAAVASWWAHGSPGRTTNLHALKMEFLGPFLFGQPSLREKAAASAKEWLLLGSEVWPMFFSQEKWSQVDLIVNVVSTTIRLCETNSSFCAYALDEVSACRLGDESSLVDVVQTHCEALQGSADRQVQAVFRVLSVHMLEFAARAQSSPLGQRFQQAVAEKEQLIAPVKERGNSNFKEKRFRAAIADYTTAIKLCPFNPVLFCNRALCFLKNEEFWCACVDSYRALVLRPAWAKAYYRCAEAWLQLGDLPAAVAVNSAGLRECMAPGQLEKQSSELQAAISAATAKPAAAAAPGKTQLAMESEAINAAADDKTTAPVATSTTGSATCEQQDSNGVAPAGSDKEGSAKSPSASTDCKQNIIPSSLASSEPTPAVHDKTEAPKSEPSPASKEPSKTKTEATKSEPSPASKEPSKTKTDATKSEPPPASKEPSKTKTDATKSEPSAASKEPSKTKTEATKSEPSPASKEPSKTKTDATKSEPSPASKEPSKTKTEATKSEPPASKEPSKTKTEATKSEPSPASKQPSKTKTEATKSEPPPASKEPSKTKTEKKKKPKVRNPFTSFEKLRYPELEDHLACKDLQEMCNKVSFKWTNPKAYLSEHANSWISYQPAWHPPPKPATDPATIKQPMNAIFDEIWCPVVVQESQGT